MPQGPEPSRSRVGEMRRLTRLSMARPSHPVPRGRTTKPRRESRQGTPTERARRRSPFAVRARGRAVSIENLKRLSATDISALASMKNVAKCDTWCELQNPVNHRVFERKLRPKPLGRGHVCLGVTHRRPTPIEPPPGLLRWSWAENGLPCASCSRLAQNRVPRDQSAATIGGNSRS